MGRDHQASLLQLHDQLANGTHSLGAEAKKGQKHEDRLTVL